MHVVAAGLTAERSGQFHFRHGIGLAAPELPHNLERLAEFDTAPGHHRVVLGNRQDRGTTLARDVE